MSDAQLPDDEAERLLQGTPDLERWKLLRGLNQEHPEHIQVKVSLQPDPKAPDPDRAPMRVTTQWSIRARGTAETQRWDNYVRYEIKKRLGVDEPTSITEDQAIALGIRDAQP